MSDRHAISPYPIRMPADLRARLEESAKHGTRSLHSEIISRLEASFDPVRVSAREPLVVVDERGPSTDGSPLHSKTISVLPSPRQLIGALEEVQSQMAVLQAQLREAYEREHQQAPESSNKE